MFIECRISPESLFEKWSNDEYGENFRESYKVFEDSRETRSGCAYLPTLSPDDQRILHWEITEGVVCLRDVSSLAPLENNAVCIHLGASAVLQTTAESSLLGSVLKITVAFVQQDGNIHRVHLSADYGISILERLVLTDEGRLLHLGGVVTSEIPAMRRKGSSSAGTKVKNGHNDNSVSLSVDFGLIQSLPADRDILSAAWVSSETLVLGLSQGDVLLVSLRTDAGEAAGVSVGKKLDLREQLLKDRGGGLQALWSDFMGRVADANSDTIDIGTASTSVLAVNRSGELRLWSAQTKQLVAHTYLYDLLDVVGTVEHLVPHRAARSPAADQDFDRNIHLQECITRVAVDAAPGGGDSDRFVLGALAVLPEAAAPSASAQTAAVSGSWGIVPETSVPLGQQTWQIYLTAWRESHGAASSAVEKPKLVSQPISFPLGSLVAGEVGDFAFRFTAASLCDMELVVDSATGVATVFTVWRAEASRTSAEGELERVTIEGVVGRTVLALGDLRAQAFTPPGPAGTGPHRVDDLQAPSVMQLVAQSAGLDMIRLRREDAALHRLRADRWAASAAEEDLLAMEEKKLKVEMLQRIFLRRRFVKGVLCAAHDAHSSKLRVLQEQVGDNVFSASNALMDWQQDHGQGLHSKAGHHLLLDQRTPLAELPGLVLEVCEAIASAKYQGVSGLLASTLGTGRDLQRKVQYLHCLQESFSAFLGECESAAARLNRVHRGSTATPAGHGAVVVAVAHRGGELRLVQESEVAPLHSQPLLSSHVGTPETRQAEALLRQVGQLFASDEALSSSLVEVDCLISSFLQDGDISSSGIAWVERYFSSLTPSLRSLLPALHDSLQSVTAGRYSCLDVLVGCESPQSLVDFADRAFAGLEHTTDGTGSAAHPQSAQRTVALVQEVTHILRQRLRNIKLVLGLLYLLRDMGHALLSQGAHSAVRDVYIPKATHSLVHYSLLLWLDTRLSTSSHMLRYDVELAGAFPLSAVLARGRSAAEELSTAGAAPVEQPDCSLSVLENFVRHYCAHHDSSAGSPLSIFSAFVPSVHSDFAVYLFRAGQYVGSAKWAAMSRLLAVRGGAEAQQVENVGDDHLVLIAPVFGDLRTHLTQLTAEYFELLRGQWFVLQGGNGSCSGALLNAIHAKGTELLGVTRELGALAGRLMAQEDGLHAQSALSSPVLRSPLQDQQKRTNFCKEVATTLCSNLRSSWKSASGPLSRGASGVAVEDSSAALECANGLLALGDAVLSVSATSQSTSFFETLLRTGGATSAQNGAISLLERQSSEFCASLHLAGLSSVLEIIDRSLPFLPREQGAVLALDGALLHVEQVTDALDLLSQSSSTQLDRAACSQALVAELHGAWSRVFEYALWHGDRYGEALEALLRVAELEEQRLVLTSTDSSAAGVTWRDSLRTLVSQACEMGQLGWLCSVPDRQLLGYAKRGLSLAEAVAATLEVLATTLDVPSAAESRTERPSGVNYFECLYTYQLSRRNYHDAARIMHRYVERTALDVGSAGQLAAALTALSVLPEDQAFLLHRSSAVGAAAVTSSGTRVAPPSPVRELDVRQLQLSFVQKLVASKMADGFAPPNSGSAEARVLALCNAAHVHAALTLATMEEDQAKSSHGPLADLPIVSLARHCVVAAAQANRAGVYCRVRNDAFLYAPYALPCAATADSAGDVDSDHWLRLLSDMLLCVGRNGGEAASRQYEIAIRALLSFHATDGAEGSSAQLQVSRPLLDALSGDHQLSSAGNPAALVRLLVEFGCLEDACLLAARLVDACNAQLEAPVGPQKMCLPYSLFDLLIDHCQQQLPRLELSGQGEHARLQQAFGRLTKILQHHFSLLVVV